MDKFLFAQVLGLIAFILSIIGICQKNRLRYIIFNIKQNIFSGFQYLLLGKDIAFYLCIFGIIRLVIYSFKSKFTLKLNIYILVFCISINIAISLLSFSSIIDLIPLIASTLVCYTVWQSNLIIIRIGVIISKGLWGIFATISLAYFSVLMDVFLIIWTIYIIKKDKKKYLKNNIKESLS